MKVDLLMLVVSLAVFAVSCFVPLAANTRTDPAEKGGLFLVDFALTMLSFVGAITAIRPHLLGTLIVVGSYVALSLLIMTFTPETWDPYGKKAKRQAGQASKT